MFVIHKNVIVFSGKLKNSILVNGYSLSKNMFFMINLLFYLSGLQIHSAQRRFAAFTCSFVDNALVPGKPLGKSRWVMGITADNTI